MAISEEKPPEEQPLYGGRYEIKSVDSSTLPDGVIEAFDAETRQLVHIKELPELSESGDVEDFLPQAELVARLKHQNLIRVMDFGTTESQIPFLVFEKFQGSNLFEYMQKNGRFKLKEGLEFCEKALEGIDYLHSKGVMHGSLSLLNVHPFKELSFMPLNLKISGLLDIYPNEYHEYDDCELPIEPFYSPEQLESEDVDFRSDVFSLGCLFYVVVTGKSPDFDRIYQAKNAVDLSDSIKNQEVSTDLAKLIQKCLEFDPDERYQDCAELKEVLESIQKNLSSKKESEDSDTEAKPSEEPVEQEEDQEEEKEEDPQASQEGYEVEEPDAEPESTDQQQPEEDIKSAEEVVEDSSIESVDGESIQEEEEEESVLLPDIDSLLDTSEPEDEESEPEQDFELEPAVEIPEPEQELESESEEPEVRDPAVEEEQDQTEVFEEEEEDDDEEEVSVAAATEIELEPEPEPEPEPTPEQVDLAKLFSEDKLATVDGDEAADKERKQLKAISASGLNALIDFKRTATDHEEQEDQEDPIQSPEILLEEEEEDSAQAAPSDSSEDLTDREDFKSIAGAFRKKESDKVAEENKPKVDFKGISDALFGDDDGLDAGQVAANIATASEAEPSAPVTTDSTSVEEAQTPAPTAEAVKIALPAEVEEISDSIGIARPATRPTDAEKEKSPQERVKSAAVASARRVASTMIAPAAKQNSYQKMVELGSSDIYTVYKAKETNTGTIVAAKTLKPVDEKVTRVFIRQAQKHSLLLHENIVRSVGSLDTSLGRPFFIMDYIKGVTLEDLLKSVGRIDTITEFAQIFEQICAAVEYAHGKSVVHGNLRPSNILLQEADGRIVVKVLDFGMSEARFEYYKVTGEAPSANYALFMSPEQFKDEPLSLSSDIYQLGVLGFKMITGIEPVTGGSFSAIMNAILEQEATSADITAYRQDLRNVKILNQILDKAMRLDPEQRFQSVAELSREIARWVQNRPTRDVDRAERESNLKAIIQDQVKLRQTQYDQEGTLMMKFTTLASGGARQSPVKATLILIAQILFVVGLSGYVILNFSDLKVKFQQMSLQLNDKLFNKKSDGADSLDSEDTEVILTGDQEAEGKTDNGTGPNAASDKTTTNSGARRPGTQSPHRSYRSSYVAPVEKKLIAPEKLPEGQIPTNRPVYPYLYTEEQVQKYSQRVNYKGRERPAAKGDSEVKVIK